MGTLSGNDLMKFYKRFLNMITLSGLQIFVSGLFHSLMTNGKKVLRKKLYLVVNDRIFLELLVERAVLILAIKVNR